MPLGDLKGKFELAENYLRASWEPVFRLQRELVES